jgi:hypothetical protein
VCNLCIYWVCPTTLFSASLLVDVIFCGVELNKRYLVNDGEGEDSVDGEIIPCPDDDELVASLYACKVHIDLFDALEVHRELADSLGITNVRETAASCQHISREISVCSA